MTTQQALRFIERHGIVLESARHRVLPNLADAAIGSDRHGSWWGHVHGHAFFALTRSVRASDDILVCRLVAGKVTYVHRRLWPAVVRLATTVGAGKLAAIREVHTATGSHRVDRVPLSRWMSRDVCTAAATLTTAAARAAIGDATWRHVKASSRRISNVRRGW